MSKQEKYIAKSGDTFRIKRLRDGQEFKRPIGLAGNAALLKKSGFICIDERLGFKDDGTNDKAVAQKPPKKNLAAENDLQNQIEALAEGNPVIEIAEGKEEAVMSVSETTETAATEKPKGKPGRKPKANEEAKEEAK